MKKHCWTMTDSILPCSPKMMIWSAKPSWQCELSRKTVIIRASTTLITPLWASGRGRGAMRHDATIQFTRANRSQPSYSTCDLRPSIAKLCRILLEIRRANCDCSTIVSCRKIDFVKISWNKRASLQPTQKLSSVRAPRTATKTKLTL